ncbi:hypothetical protein [Amnibacterium sp.]|uniref:hypothetical protein n=1 Tax=Amnibacterium sp. TaxID=1872496 RepID=UPI003F7C3FC8
MFEAAVQAATAAARSWTPDRPEPARAHRCCPLCLDRYRILVLDGPLQDLPHGVAHPAVAAVDELIGERISDMEERYARDPWTVLLSDADRQADLDRRLRTTRGALLVVALEELADAAPQLAELRLRYTEPATVSFLALHPPADLPPAWM